MAKQSNEDPDEQIIGRLPDAAGHFGPYGGKFASETLMQALDELREQYYKVKDDADFQKRFDDDLYAGQPNHASG